MPDPQPPRNQVRAVEPHPQQKSGHRQSRWRVATLGGAALPERGLRSPRAAQGSRGTRGGARVVGDATEIAVSPALPLKPTPAHFAAGEVGSGRFGSRPSRRGESLSASGAPTPAGTRRRRGRSSTGGASRPSTSGSSFLAGGRGKRREGKRRGEDGLGMGTGTGTGTGTERRTGTGM